MRRHHLAVTYVLGRFMTDHFVRVYKKAFDGDLTAAIVLGTIGQYNYRRYCVEVGGKAARRSGARSASGWTRTCRAGNARASVKHTSRCWRSKSRRSAGLQPAATGA
jgi:hypothetical protein